MEINVHDIDVPVFNVPPSTKLRGSQLFGIFDGARCSVV